MSIVISPVRREWPVIKIMGFILRGISEDTEEKENRIVILEKGKEKFSSSRTGAREDPERGNGDGEIIA